MFVIADLLVLAVIILIIYKPFMWGMRWMVERVKQIVKEL